MPTYGSNNNTTANGTENWYIPRPTFTSEYKTTTLKIKRKIRCSFCSKIIDKNRKNIITMRKYPLKVCPDCYEMFNLLLGLLKHTSYKGALIKALKVVNILSSYHIRYKAIKTIKNKIKNYKKPHLIKVENYQYYRDYKSLLNTMRLYGCYVCEKKLDRYVEMRGETSMTSYKLCRDCEHIVMRLVAEYKRKRSEVIRAINKYIIDDYNWLKRKYKNEALFTANILNRHVRI